MLICYNKAYNNNATFGEKSLNGTPKHCLKAELFLKTKREYIKLLLYASLIPKY